MYFGMGFIFSIFILSHLNFVSEQGENFFRYGLIYKRFGFVNALRFVYIPVKLTHFFFG